MKGIFIFYIITDLKKLLIFNKNVFILQVMNRNIIDFCFTNCSRTILWTMFLWNFNNVVSYNIPITPIENKDNKL